MDTPIEKRAMKPDTYLGNASYRLEVIEEVEVNRSLVAKWFGQPGHGVQYKFKQKLDDLIREGKVRVIEYKPSRIGTFIDGDYTKPVNTGKIRIFEPGWRKVK